MNQATQNIVESIFESGIAALPRGSFVSMENGDEYTAVYLIHEWIDAYAVSSPFEYTSPNFRPMSFFDRVKGNGGMHLNRRERVRVAILDEGKLRMLDAADVNLIVPSKIPAIASAD